MNTAKGHFERVKETADPHQIMALVKENCRRLKDCQGHNFVDISPGNVIKKYRCTNCEGEIDAMAYRYYEQGVEHGKRQAEKDAEQKALQTGSHIAIMIKQSLPITTLAEIRITHQGYTIRVDWPTPDDKMHHLVDTIPAGEPGDGNLFYHLHNFTQRVRREILKTHRPINEANRP